MRPRALAWGVTRRPQITRARERRARITDKRQTRREAGTQSQ